MSDVAATLRGMASGEAVWFRDDQTREALSAGTDEIERLRTELAAAQAQARGAQYREREARNEAAMLRAALGAMRSTPDAGDLAGLGARAVR